MTDSAPSPERDFFISYTGSDRPWAQWIGWFLEEKGYTVFIDVWDFRPGSNFALEMQKGTQCKQTIAVMSQAYLEADYTNPEWAAAFSSDPQGEAHKLIPVRIEDFDPTGLLQSIVYVDFVGLSEEAAKDQLLAALKPRGKPDTPPAFPKANTTAKTIIREVAEKVGFPSAPEVATEEKDPEKPVSASTAPNAKGSATAAKSPFWPLTGVIDNPAQFFNCEDTLNRIFESLNGGSSVAIIGEPNMGKSSLLWAVSRMAAARLESPRHPVLLNLARVFSEQEFYADLCQALEMKTVTGNAFVRAMYQQEKQVLLLLDEVERISQKEFTHHIRQELRGLSEGSDAPLRLVIASRISLDKLFPESYLEGQTSPLEGITVEEPICPWSDETARAFIADRLPDGPIQFTAVEIEQLVNDCQGNPQKLTQACHQLYNRYRET
ncbi:MAG: TIR domain-containing protein [Cyanobacteria bacterium J06659_2]